MQHEDRLQRLILVLAERVYRQSELLTRKACRTMTFPPQVLQHHCAILGKTGSGKTSTAKLLVEQIAEQRVCILDPIKSDWWGITLMRDGKARGLDYRILGGPHGHVHLHSNAGEAIGRLVASGQLPRSILDMSDFEAGGLQRFFSAFAAALLRHMKGVVHLVIEEAHEFAPKERAGIGDENQSIHWAKKLATAGRSKGIRLVVATQRVQSLHNAVLGSCETLIAHRLTTPADQKPIIQWLESNAGKERAKTVAAGLSSLPTGTAWFCSGEAQIFEKKAFPRIATYDNSATPTGSDSATATPHPVDTAALKSLIESAMQETSGIKKKPAAIVTQTNTTNTTTGAAMSVESKLDQLIQLMSRPGQPTPNNFPRPMSRIPPLPPRPPFPPAGKTPPSEPFDEDALYQRLFKRLLEELPLQGNTYSVTPPEKLRKDFQEAEVARIVAKVAEMTPLQKTVLRFVVAVSGHTGQDAIAKRIGRSNNGDLSAAVRALCAAGFVEVKTRVGVRSRLFEKLAEDLSAYQATEDEVESVYNSIVFELTKE